jgi:hypothetical protein
MANSSYYRRQVRNAYDSSSKGKKRRVVYRHDATDAQLAELRTLRTSHKIEHHRNNLNFTETDDVERDYRELLSGMHWGRICSILLLPYKEFLTTSYWRIVSRYVREQRGNTCQECHSTEHLQAHHTSYEYHGFEHDPTYMDYLKVLCRRCHQSLNLSVNVPG